MIVEDKIVEAEAETKTTLKEVVDNIPQEHVDEAMKVVKVSNTKYLYPTGVKRSSTVSKTHKHFDDIELAEVQVYRDVSLKIKKNKYKPHCGKQEMERNAKNYNRGVEA